MTQTALGLNHLSLSKVHLKATSCLQDCSWAVCLARAEACLPTALPGGCVVLESPWPLQPPFSWQSGKSLAWDYSSLSREISTIPTSPESSAGARMPFAKSLSLYLNYIPNSSQSEILPEIKREPFRHLKLNIAQLCSCLGFCRELLSRPHSLQSCIPYSAIWSPTINCMLRLCLVSALTSLGTREYFRASLASDKNCKPKQPVQTD